MIPEYYKHAPLSEDQVIALGFVKDHRPGWLAQSFVLSQQVIRLTCRDGQWNLFANLTHLLCRVRNLHEVYVAMLVLNCFESEMTDYQCHWDTAFGMAGYALGERDALILQQDMNTGEHTEAKYAEIKERFEGLTCSPFPSDAFSMGYSDAFDHISSIYTYARMKKDKGLLDWPDDYTKLDDQQAAIFCEYVQQVQDRLIALADA